jgi:hypothetical protein
MVFYVSPTAIEATSGTILRDINIETRPRYNTFSYYIDGRIRLKTNTNGRKGKCMIVN